MRSNYNPMPSAPTQHTHLSAHTQVVLQRDCAFPHACNQNTFSFPACMRDRTVEANKYLSASEEGDKTLCVCVCERESEEEQWGRRWNNRNQEREIKRRQIMRWNDEWERERRQSYSAEGLLTNGRNLHFKFRLCLDVIYPDHFYTWKCFQCRRWNTSS